MLEQEYSAFSQLSASATVGVSDEVMLSLIMLFVGEVVVLVVVVVIVVVVVVVVVVVAVVVVDVLAVGHSL